MGELGVSKKRSCHLSMRDCSEFGRNEYSSVNKGVGGLGPLGVWEKRSIHLSMKGWRGSEEEKYPPVIEGVVE